MRHLRHWSSIHANISLRPQSALQDVLRSDYSSKYFLFWGDADTDFFVLNLKTEAVSEDLRGVLESQYAQVWAIQKKENR